MRGIHLEDNREWVDRATWGVEFYGDLGLPQRYVAWLGRRAGMLGVQMRNDGVHLLGMHVVPPGEEAAHRVDPGREAPLHPASPAHGGVLLSNTPDAWGKTAGEMRVYMTPALTHEDIAMLDGEPDNPLLRVAKHALIDVGERMMAGPADSMRRIEFDEAKLGLVGVSRVWLGRNPSELPSSGLTPAWAVYVGERPLVEVGSVPAYQAASSQQLH